MEAQNNGQSRPICAITAFNVQTMVQHVMKRGKKSTATRVMYEAMDLIKERTQKNPLEVFDAALKNVSPAMEVRPRRVGGATYQVPMEVAADRRTDPGDALDLDPRPRARRQVVRR